VDTYALICCCAYHPYGSTVTSRSVSPSLLWYQHVTSKLPRGSSRAHRPKEAFWASLFGSSRYSNRINHEAQVPIVLLFLDKLAIASLLCIRRVIVHLFDKVRGRTSTFRVLSSLRLASTRSSKRSKTMSLSPDKKCSQPNGRPLGLTRRAFGLTATVAALYSITPNLAKALPYERLGKAARPEVRLASPPITHAFRLAVPTSKTSNSARDSLGARTPPAVSGQTGL
jgi:hypothetical protein